MSNTCTTIRTKGILVRQTKLQPASITYAIPVVSSDAPIEVQEYFKSIYNEYKSAFPDHNISMENHLKLTIEDKI